MRKNWTLVSQRSHMGINQTQKTELVSNFCMKRILTSLHNYQLRVFCLISVLKLRQGETQPLILIICQSPTLDGSSGKDARGQIQSSAASRPRPQALRLILLNRFDMSWYANFFTNIMKATENIKIGQQFYLFHQF